MTENNEDYLTTWDRLNRATRENKHLRSVIVLQGYALAGLLFFLLCIILAKVK